MKKRNTIASIIIVIFLIAIAICSLLYLKNGDGQKQEEIIIEEEPIVEVEKNYLDVDDKTNKLLKEKIDKYQENEAINKDYVGNIFFESELIDCDFVQATSLYDQDGKHYTFYLEEGGKVTSANSDSACDGKCSGNDVYIWTNWKTGKWDKYEEGGSVFVDYRNTLTDQNIIIYGHHFARDWDPSGSKQFTPVDLLLEEENYEANKYLDIVFENEIRRYEVASIYVADITGEDDIQCLRTNFDVNLYGESDPDYFEHYKEFLKENEKYDTGVEMTSEDNYITLFTCIQHKPQYREVVICKEIGRCDY